MLLPTQQTHALAATDMMRSMLENIEEQRRQDEEERTGKERDKVTEARIGASDEAKRAQDKIASAMFGVNNSDPNEVKIKLVERLANKLGIDIDDARSSYKLGKALEDALKDIGPAETRALEKHLGLQDMGVSIKTLLAAIKNSYGDDNQRLMEGINRQINGGKLDTEIGRIVQRLENTANPKSLEELKLGPQGYDPTRVEDGETRAERRQDIEAAEAGEKLEDVQETREAIEKLNDRSLDTAEPESGNPSEDAALEATTLITTLAAGVEQDLSGAEAAEDAGSAEGKLAEAPQAGLEQHTNGDAKVVAARTAEAKAAQADKTGILPVRIDEIGLYELLEKKLAA